MDLFGSSGTRGVVGTDLTPGFVERLAAVAATQWDAERVAIGRDTRRTGQMLANAASSGVASAGVDVERVGILPTPALQSYLATERIPGCMITASHNPPTDNGVKLFDAAGVELGGESLDRIETAFQARRRRRARWDETGIESRIEGVARDYVDEIVAAVDADAIRERSFTVAIDPGHGAGIHTTPQLCRALGCRVVSVNATVDGTFPGRSPEPVPAVLEDLCRLVRASDADLGVAHDGDADRAMFVDERGEVVDGDTLLALLAAAVVSPGDTVVTAVDASQRLVDTVRERRGTLERTPIGSANLVEGIRRCQGAGQQVPLAGEGNGGVFFPEHRVARDGAFVLARMLELVGERPLGERAAAFDEYHLIRRTIEYGSAEERARMVAGVDAFAATAEAHVDRTDGIRLDFEDGWALARPSGTEPLIRVIAEASHLETAERYADRLTDAVEAA